MEWCNFVVAGNGFKNLRLKLASEQLLKNMFVAAARGSARSF